MTTDFKIRDEEMIKALFLTFSAYRPAEPSTKKGFLIWTFIKELIPVHVVEIDIRSLRGRTQKDFTDFLLAAWKDAEAEYLKIIAEKEKTPATDENAGEGDVKK